MFPHSGNKKYPVISFEVQSCPATPAPTPSLALLRGRPLSKRPNPRAPQRPRHLVLVYVKTSELLKVGLSHSVYLRFTNSVDLKVKEIGKIWNWKYLCKVPEGQNIYTKLHFFR